MRALEKRKCTERKKPEGTAVFFQGFSRKQVDICTWQKTKHRFLEWAKCHTNRWQKCRHAREQVYELMHGHLFCPGMLKQQFWKNISTPKFTESCHYQPSFKLASNGYRFSFLKDVFAFSYFDNHSNISHTNIYLNEREVVLCHSINIFDFYYFKRIYV